ncbi:TRAP-type C4-dicarboxylate transport system, small permease component [Tistlia consotensis]|uniref:TRAP transporter small permease protein n=1 Tax=Tistlia consotensis USBA 355 TaxID=560819 RepID=A0A1Y6CI38_9PROT|nr:TRAP transporter small permease [Tistlia consotensis]SMF65826.1 TRAP-type C4-dicarboxylate transport system, small permease component [Tistlia consotensis USBA 355]SNS03108.1 TRAP-type C4-dicarboxylate transport system, small permease component [Tistlia consotensis]
MTYARIHGAFDALLARGEAAAAVLAGCGALAAMLLVSADAVIRHLFAQPLTFQLYFTEHYLLVSMALLALPWGFRTGGFIRIEGFAMAVPLSLRGPLLRTGLLAGAGYIGYLGWLGLGKFQEALAGHEVDMGVIDWPIAWSWIWVPLGCGLLALRLTLAASAPTAPLFRTTHD